MKKISAVILALSSLCFGQNPCNQPGVIFCNGFEGNTQEVNSAWENNTASNYSVVDPGPFNVAGNKVLKLDVEIMTHVRKGLGAGYDRLYARWYQKFPANYDWPLSYSHHGFTYSSSTASGASAYVPWGCPTDSGIGTIADIWIQMEPNREEGNGVHWYAYHPGKETGWGDVYRNGSVMTTNRWYCIETMIDLGTPTPTAKGANGILDTWIDGVHHGPNTCGSWPAICGGIWFRTCNDLKIRYVDIMSTSSGRQPLGTGIYYDDVVVSTQPIGPGTRVPYFQIPLAITNSQLTAATVGIPYSIFLSASGGAKDYTWQLVSGTLPPGLTFSPIGGIRGTPSQTGTFSFTVRATDKSSPVQTADKVLSLKINPSTGITLSRDLQALSGITAQVRSNKLVLAFPARTTVKTIRLQNALGQTVWQHAVKQGATSAESPALPNGLYAGRIGDGSKAASFRFAVMR